MRDCISKADVALKAFIEVADFSWTVEDIKEQYGKYLNKEYISHTAKQCCKFYEKIKDVL